MNVLSEFMEVVMEKVKVRCSDCFWCGICEDRVLRLGLGCDFWILEKDKNQWQIDARGSLKL